MNTQSIPKDQAAVSVSYSPSQKIEEQRPQETDRDWKTLYGYAFGLIGSLVFKKPTSSSNVLLPKEEEEPSSEPPFELTTQEQKKEFEFLFQEKKHTFTKICANIGSEGCIYYEKTELFPYSFLCIPKKTSYVFLKTRSRRLPEKKYPKIGRGSNASVTLCYDSQQEAYKVCRSIRKELVKKNEWELNTCLAKDLKDISVEEVKLESKQPYSRYFATAEIYPYTKNGKDEKKPWKQGDKVAFIMTYYENGDLYRALSSEILAPLLAKRKREILRHILEGLDILHTELGWIWNDLKPANILLTKDLEPRLADFGSACKIGASVNPRFTPLYKCPENEISTKRDIWSLGVLLFDLVYGPNTWKEKMFSQSFTFETLAMLSNEEKMTEKLHQLLPEKRRVDPKHPDSLIHVCLQYNPKNRPCAKKLLELLEAVEF